MAPLALWVPAARRQARLRCWSARLGGGLCVALRPSCNALDAIGASGSRHSFQAHHTAHVIDEILQPDLCR
ncbi:MAG: hypothetical protein GY877_10555, partial [Hyphomicrobium sp.]|nr:hypothetical protein [Hyphomicrobium sp.]